MELLVRCGGRIIKDDLVNWKPTTTYIGPQKGTLALSSMVRDSEKFDPWRLMRPC